MEQSLKKKSQPDCSTRGNYQLATPLSGITPPTRIRNGEGGKKQQSQAILHHRDFMGHVS